MAIRQRPTYLANEFFNEGILRDVDPIGGHVPWADGAIDVGGGISTNEIETIDPIGGGGGGGIIPINPPGSGVGSGGWDGRGGTGTPPGTNVGTPTLPGNVDLNPFIQALLNLPVFRAGTSEEARRQAEATLLMISTLVAQMDAAQRQAFFSAVYPAISPFLMDGGQGFSPDALAAMRGEALDTTTNQFQAAEQGVRTDLARRGLRTGSTPTSGLAAHELSNLASQRAVATSGALRNVTTQNEVQRLSNLFNAANVAQGNPANPAAAIGAGANVANTMQNEPGGLGSSVLGSILGSAASAAGSALGGLINRIPGLGTSTGRTPPINPNPFITPSFFPGWR